MRQKHGLQEPNTKCQHWKITSYQTCCRIFSNESS